MLPSSITLECEYYFFFEFKLWIEYNQLREIIIPSKVSQKPGTEVYFFIQNSHSKAELKSHFKKGERKVEKF